MLWSSLAPPFRVTEAEAIELLTRKIDFAGCTSICSSYTIFYSTKGHFLFTTVVNVIVQPLLSLLFMFVSSVRLITKWVDDETKSIGYWSRKF